MRLLSNCCYFLFFLVVLFQDFLFVAFESVDVSAAFLPHKVNACSIHLKVKVEDDEEEKKSSSSPLSVYDVCVFVSGRLN